MTELQALAGMPAFSAPVASNVDFIASGPFLVSVAGVETIGTELDVTPNDEVRFFDQGRDMYVYLPVDSSVEFVENTVRLGDSYVLSPLTLEWDSPYTKMFDNEGDLRDFLYQLLVDPSVAPKYFVTTSEDSILGVYRSINSRVYVRENSDWVLLNKLSTELEDADRTYYVINKAIDLYDEVESADSLDIEDFREYIYAE